MLPFQLHTGTPGSMQQLAEHTHTPQVTNPLHAQRPFPQVKATRIAQSHVPCSRYTLRVIQLRIERWVPTWKWALYCNCWHRGTRSISVVSAPLAIDTASSSSMQIINFERNQPREVVSNEEEGVVSGYKPHAHSKNVSRLIWAEFWKLVGPSLLGPAN